MIPDKEEHTLGDVIVALDRLQHDLAKIHNVLVQIHNAMPTGPPFAVTADGRVWVTTGPWENDAK